MSESKITLLPHGPLLVSGKVALIDSAGNPVDLGGRDSYALCRCGASKMKPMCDGSHKACGFTDA